VGDYPVTFTGVTVNETRDTTGNYVVTEVVPGKLTIDPAQATIAVNSASKVAGEADPVFTGTVEGLVHEGDLGEVRYVRTNDDEAPGTYAGVLTATYDENPNYDVNVAKGDFTIKAILTLRWLDSDGSVLQEKTYTEGEEAPAFDGKEPSKAATAQYSYTFSGWDEGTVEGTVKTYKPLFGETVNQYTVTFMDYDGKTVLKEAVRYDFGTAPDAVALPSDPKREADEQYTYAFAGWTPEIAEVTGDAVYTATYTSKAIVTPAPEPAKITYTCSKGGNGTYVQSSGKDLEFIYNRSENDEETFAHFKGIMINDLVIEDKYYEAASGSVRIKISAAYLDNLQAGGYSLKPLFDDGEAEGAAFTIEKAAETPTVQPTETPTKTPQRGKTDSGANTGDSSQAWLWLLLGAAALVGMSAVMFKRRDSR
jgi:LPXTG-motif cell wall-anchored protein